MDPSTPTPMTLRQAIDFAAELQRAGRFSEAEDIYRQVLAARPDSAEALCNLAGLLVARGENDEAATLLRRATAAEPGRAAAHEALGHVCLELKLFSESEISFRRAIAIQPSGELHFHLASVLRRQGNLDESLGELKKAEEQGFVEPRLYNELGVIQYQRGEFAAATQLFARASEMSGDYPLARFNLALLQLLQGDFENGWEGYERRFEARSVPMPARYAQRGMWNGSDIGGKTILFDCEQGFGDAIQFARFIPILAGRGAKPIVLARPELRRVMQGVEGIEKVICPGESIPPFDAQCPLLSLGRLLGVRLETIPANVPYVCADRNAVRRWLQRMPTGQRRIGLCWAGGEHHPENQVRSLKQQDLAPLADLTGAWYCSLQKAPAIDAATWPRELRISDWTRELSDFAETAALIENLDLVISCDTAVAHLAGAMGKPVWLMLRKAPDWRWLLDREDSPWYPTMRIFRQANVGDWSEVIRRIMNELAPRQRQHA